MLHWPTEPEILLEFFEAKTTHYFRRRFFLVYFIKNFTDFREILRNCKKKLKLKCSLRSKKYFRDWIILYISGQLSGVSRVDLFLPLIILYFIHFSFQRVCMLPTSHIRILFPWRLSGFGFPDWILGNIFLLFVIGELFLKKLSGKLRALGLG